ncbi:MAG: MBOAT family O-acyltransferase [Lachnospiraceae bacterium]|nr:MBOAT family O-acyltransferase [Lachnospiraceae bacterium]
MSLLSGKFVLFFLCVFAAYFLMPRKSRWVVLLIGSYVFYLFSSVRMTAYLLLTTFTTFFSAKRIGALNKETSEYLTVHKAELDRETKKQYKAGQMKRKRRYLLFAVLWNIGTLCVLKYTGFVFDTINRTLHFVADMEAVLPSVRFMLPLGISFYTFQTVGYVIDVYRGKYEPDTSLPKYMLFVSFFPQIIQGPISRYNQLAHQLYEGHEFDYTRITMGLQLVLWGLIKKLVLADRLIKVSNMIFQNYTDYAGLTMFIGGTVYGVYMYADFSGGIDMIRGIAQVFGIEMMQNFERPYFATSLSEFWRRWHISLGEWMRDYVFYPVSLSKAFGRLGKKTKKWFGTKTGKVIPTYLATFITFMLVGIWQGTELKYVGYGFWNASIIAGSLLLKPVFTKTLDFLHIKADSFYWKAFGMLRTFFLCSLGRFFSGGLSLKSALVMMKSFFTVWNPQVLTDGTFLNMGLTRRDWLVVLIMLIIMLIVGILQERGIRIRSSIAGMPLPMRWFIYIGAIVFVVLLGQYGPGFVSADFVYQQF